MRTDFKVCTCGAVHFPEDDHLKVCPTARLKAIREPDEADTPKPPQNIQSAPAVALSPAAPLITVRDTEPVTEKYRSWQRYTAMNPSVRDVLVDLLRRAKNEKGYDKWSIQGAVEIARWFRSIRIEGDWDFKISNSFAAYYSRQIMMEEPDLYGFITTKRSSADWEMGWDKFVADREREESAAHA